MNPTEAKGLNWIQEYWPQILFFMSLGTLGVKSHMDVKRLKQAVFDNKGSVQLQPKSDCEKYQDGCRKQRDEFNHDRIRELQNIHSAIEDLRKIVIGNLGSKK